jgi:multidrug efflux system membrane fusion protein
MNRRRWIAAGSFCAVAVIALLAASKDATPKKKPGAPPSGSAGAPEVPVEAAVVTQGDVDVTLVGLGAVTPEATVTMRSRVDGELMNVGYREGEIVQRGQLLALIDPRPYEAQLALAKGQFDRDAAVLENNRRDLKRYETLSKQDSIARQQYETQISVVRQQEGTVAADRGSVASAAVQLAYTRITAPVTGRVGLRLVDPGNIVHAADTTGLVVLTQLQPITVIFSVAEDVLPPVMEKLRRGETLNVDALNRTGTELIASGHLLTADNVVDATTGTVRLRAEFENDDLRLFPGQFVNARLLLSVERDRPLVPAAAVQRGAAAPFVYVIKPGDVVEAREVTFGPTAGDRIAVEQGLQPGERVVVDGADRVRQGTRVTLRGAQDGGTRGPSDRGESIDGGGSRRGP